MKRLTLLATSSWIVLLVAPLAANGQSGSDYDECISDGVLAKAECERLYGGGTSVALIVALVIGVVALAGLAIWTVRRRRASSGTSPALSAEDPSSQRKTSGDDGESVSPTASPRTEQEPGVGKLSSAERIGEAEPQPAPHAAGWYDNPGGPGIRYWDGESWTGSYHPGHPEPAAAHRTLLWAISLAFGVAGGVVGALSIPVLAFYWPLGFGAAGLATAIAALTVKGPPSPWYAIIAVIGSVAALGLGISAYNEFQDVQNDLADVRRDLQGVLGP
jgi:hypothetical protein